MLEFNATFLISLISFVIFIFIMNMIFYKPILTAMNERKRLVDTNYEDAKKCNDKSDELLKQKDEKLDGALVQSRKIISDKTDEMNKKSKILLDETKALSLDKIKNAKDEINQQVETSQSELSDSAVDIAKLVTSKILDDSANVSNSNIIETAQVVN
ncbi:MAG: ATP synthase F0 subunit B [Candidatus Gastranaerophilales bacterium]